MWLKQCTSMVLEILQIFFQKFLKARMYCEILFSRNTVLRTFLEKGNTI